METRDAYASKNHMKLTKLSGANLVLNVFGFMYFIFTYLLPLAHLFINLSTFEKAGMHGSLWVCIIL